MHVTRIEIRNGRGVVITTAEGVRCRSPYAGLCERTLSPSARGGIERFYDRIDRDLAAWERRRFPRKKKRHGGKKAALRRRAKRLAKLLLGGDGEVRT